MARAGRDILWAEALAILARSERPHRSAFRPTTSGWEPPVDIVETEAGLLIVVAMPGVRPADMEIIFGNGEVLIRGTRRWPTPHRPARVHRIELPHGSFERHLPLPVGTFRLVGQDHEDGCLLLTLRRLD